ncbi:cytochrome P460 [Photobacterium gaetbulicola]|uniref:Putative cytochrome P460 n=1 Tax=Photobacterium gaetbulicola Gung47 TaxID=658445 RepID=A0A0C5WH92_9GAMM|nr:MULTISPECIES: cytochrome P460 family protein [Photobacterium]AJR06503.1 putative cytochrome P460 [Photobacterium gaetbulicola Gung47]PSU03575.1 cytochrome P460 [Photobacterium gaetbulicola]WEM44590.1 cytochrome P460 family protein [Photobacterium sp. DA100]
MTLRDSFLASLAMIVLPAVAHADTPEPSNSIAYPVGWQEWATIAVSHRTDNNTVRAILGNPIAVAAAREGKTNPWPDGAILGKVVWKSTTLEHWPAATAPGEFVHAEFMFRDSKKYAETYGWGWGRWLGQSQTPFNEGPQACIACHTPVKDRNWVFTEPAFFPEIK